MMVLKPFYTYLTGSSDPLFRRISFSSASLQNPLTSLYFPSSNRSVTSRNSARNVRTSWMPARIAFFRSKYRPATPQMIPAGWFRPGTFSSSRWFSPRFSIGSKYRTLPFGDGAPLHSVRDIFPDPRTLLCPLEENRYHMIRMVRRPGHRFHNKNGRTPSVCTRDPQPSVTRF